MFQSRFRQSSGKRSPEHDVVSGARAWRDSVANRRPGTSQFHGRSIVVARRDADRVRWREGIYVIAADHAEAPRLLIAGTTSTRPALVSGRIEARVRERRLLFGYGEEMLGNVETSRVFVFDLQTRRTTQISTGESLNVSPAWLPDNRTVALRLQPRRRPRCVQRQTHR